MVLGIDSIRTALLLGFLTGLSVGKGHYHSTANYRCFDDKHPYGYYFMISFVCANIPEPPKCYNRGRSNLTFGEKEGDDYIESSGCFYYYYEEDCAGASVKVESSDKYKITRGERMIRSVRSCDTLDKSLKYIDARIKLYAHVGFKSTVEDYLLYARIRCRNLEPRFTNKASSAKLPFCLILYSEEGCKGDTLRLEKGEYENLADFYFNDVTQSYSVCNYEDVLIKKPIWDRKTANLRNFTKVLETQPGVREVKGEMVAKTNLNGDMDGNSTLQHERKTFKGSNETCCLERVAKINQVSLSAPSSCSYAYEVWWLLITLFLQVACAQCNPIF